MHFKLVCILNVTGLEWGVGTEMQIPRRSCRGGADLKDNEDHMLSCILLLGTANTNRHDTIGEVLLKYARRARWIADLRPHWLYSGDLRPDGDFFSESGRELIDMTVSHPSAVS